MSFMLLAECTMFIMGITIPKSNHYNQEKGGGELGMLANSTQAHTNAQPDYANFAKKRRRIYYTTIQYSVKLNVVCLFVLVRVRNEFAPLLHFISLLARIWPFKVGQIEAA